MKTAGWSTRRVASQVDRSDCAVRNCWEQWTRKGTHVRKTGSGATRKTTRREDRAASTCGPHSDSFNDTSRRRRSNCSTNNFQTPCRSKSSIQAPFPCTPLNIGNCVYSGAKPDQCGLSQTVIESQNLEQKIIKSFYIKTS
ncbi:transposable element Tcb2 transposase [Trichonephila clavipes]|nr:transposable element Tcb2 transposase [Trichonephila clavipes]